MTFKRVKVFQNFLKKSKKLKKISLKSLIKFIFTKE